MAPISLYQSHRVNDQEYQHPTCARGASSMAPVKNPFISSTAFLNETSRIQPIVKVDALFSRGISALHRRNASSGTIGIAVGLTILSIIIIGGLFYCAWENTRAEKRRLMKEKEKRKHRHHRHETHIRGGHRRHSKKHHHVHNHGEHHDYFDNLYIPEQQHDEKHHHKCKAHQHRHCRHKRAHDRHERKLWKRQHRCRHKHDNPPSPIIDDWAPQRPEPILQSPIAFVPKYDGLLMNEMDAPQIGRDFQVGDCFPQCVKGVDGIVCPRHGIVRDERK